MELGETFHAVQRRISSSLSLYLHSPPLQKIHRCWCCFYCRREFLAGWWEKRTIRMCRFRQIGRLFDLQVTKSVILWQVHKTTNFTLCQHTFFVNSLFVGRFEMNSNQFFRVCFCRNSFSYGKTFNCYVLFTENFKQVTY